MNMRELEKATGQPARLIRYLISEKVVPPPEGQTRSASYDDRHVAALRRYAELKGKGYGSLEVIKAEIAAAAAEPGVTILHPAEGIEIRIEADAMARLDVESAIEGIRAAFAAHAAKTSQE